MIIKDIINKLDKFNSLKELSQVGGIDANILVILENFYSKQEIIFVLLPNLDECQKYYDKLSTMLPNDTYIFPHDQTFSFLSSICSLEFRTERMYTIYSLLEKNKGLVLSTADGLSQYLLSPSDYINAKLSIKANEDYSIQELEETLISNGFRRNYTVSNTGEYSRKGSILDIFLPFYQNPIRLDFFGDHLETIKLFDISTQRSLTSLEEIIITPLFDIFYNSAIKQKTVAEIKKYFASQKLSNQEKIKLDADLFSIENKRDLSSLNLYTIFFCHSRQTIIDFFQSTTLYIVGFEEIIQYDDKVSSEIESFNEMMGGKSFTSFPFRARIIDFLKHNYKALKKVSDNQNEFKRLEKVDDIFTKMKSNQYDMFIFFSKSNEIRKEFEDLANNFNVKYSSNLEEDSKNYFLNEALNLNLILPNSKIMIVSESLKTSKALNSSSYHSVLFETKKISSFTELEEEDYVVHYDYGIGIFLGIKTILISGQKKDFLILEYARKERLFVPIEQINLVLKYDGNTETEPNLNSLTNSNWKKSLTETKVKAKELGDYILKLNAARAKEIGFMFPADPQKDKEIKEGFEFQETGDQIKAIEETYADMQSSKPMSRLIIGDVGFGKTEVAIRATYRCCNSMKQTAYLVPTTILARQHYLTFKERFDKLNIRVEFVSRLQKPSQITSILNDVKLGKVDVLIGTHRLLSKDVEFRDLGLLIIDEEQRFGVKQKEKIVELQTNIDTLTLTATPIPRTLQLANLGLREFSLIETPPKNRYPIQTYLVARNDYIIKDAIEKELSRKGQVFYLFNDTVLISDKCQEIARLVPNARITYVHGQMDKNEIETKISDFVEHKFDVIVATTIIETGIDIPNANTLLIHDVSMLGLSQLYQIRGRVGRSNKIAYAYLMYDRFKKLAENAQKRMKAISTFTELGSGYKLALRDLAIRGAGNIIGAEQSGFIDTVGLNFYLKLVSDAMNNIDTFKSVKDKYRDNKTYSDRSIPDTYIEDDATRIEIHKKIASLTSLEEIKELEEEMRDRFGTMPESILDYMHESLFKYLSDVIKIDDVNYSSKTVGLRINLELTTYKNKIGSYLKKHSDVFLKNNGNNIYIMIEIPSTHWLKKVNITLSNIINEP